MLLKVQENSYSMEDDRRGHGVKNQYTLDEVAQHLKINKQDVFNIEQEVMNKIFNELIKGGYNPYKLFEDMVEEYNLDPKWLFKILRIHIQRAIQKEVK